MRMLLVILSWFLACLADYLTQANTCIVQSSWWRPDRIFSLVTKPSTDDKKQDEWGISFYDFSPYDKYYEETEKKKKAPKKRSLWIIANRYWEPNLQDSQFKELIFTYIFFSWQSTFRKGKDKERLFIFLVLVGACRQRFKGPMCKNCYLLPVFCLMSQDIWVSQLLKSQPYHQKL